jgi:hypothetical protein
VTGGWRDLHNEKLYNSYSAPNVRMLMTRRMRWTGNMYEGGDKFIPSSGLKPEGMRSLRRPNHR